MMPSERKDKTIRRNDPSLVAGQASRRIKLPVWKKLLFTVITLGALFAVFEIVLAVVGVRPALYEEDPYVGFSSYVPLFVEQAGPDGETMMVTAKNKRRFFNSQRFARNKAAGTYRIFCAGGSTTFGRPYDDMTSFCGWLRAMLPKADPSREWELINAGGISYASYRVAVLMEELIRYEPDLFIIYSGHNEFLEHRTYARIVNLPSSVRSWGAIMSHTRIYAAVKQSVDGLGGTSAGTVENRTNLPGEVETILDHSVGPESYHRDPQWQRQVLSHYHYNLLRMVDIAQSVGTKVILVTPASNLLDCSPFRSEHRNGLANAEQQEWQVLFNQASKADAEGQGDEALTAIDEAITVDDRYAHAHYLRGRILWKLQRYDEARTAFVRAIDEDICPLRAPRPMLDIIADVAQERSVPVVDFVALVERQSEHATPGENLFLDHVHPTIEANRQLAMALLAAMGEQGIVRFTSEWGDVQIKRVAAEVESRLDPQAQGSALRNLSRLFRWAGIFEEGRKLGLRATQLVPDDAEAHLMAGANAAELGLLDEAIGHYRQALGIKPNYAEAHGKLGDAVAKKGKLDEAISHYRRALHANPDYAHAHSNLGVALSAKGELDEAVRHFRQALKTKPDYVPAGYHLGSVLRVQGKLAEAQSQFHQVLQIDPDHAEALCGLGMTLQSQGKLDEAIGCFRQALRIKPEYAEAHGNVGDVLSGMGRLDEAISHYRQAIEADRNYAHAHCNLGVAMFSKGELDEAAKHFQQALAIKPDYAEALNNLGSVLLAHDRLDEAINHYRQALQIRPDDAGLHHNLGRALAKAGEIAGALEHFREAVRLKPNWPPLLNDMARVLATQRDPTGRNRLQAIRFAERAAKLTGNQNVSILDTLAMAYAAAGQFDRAVTTTQIAIRLASAAQADEQVDYLRKQLERYRRAVR